MKWKRDKSKDDGSEKSNREKALVAVTTKDEQPTELALTSTEKAFIDAAATAHMMKDLSVNTGRTVLSHIGMGTLGRNTIKGTAQVSLLLGCLAGRSRLF